MWIIIKVVTSCMFYLQLGLGFLRTKVFDYKFFEIVVSARAETIERIITPPLLQKIGPPPGSYDPRNLENTKPVSSCFKSRSPRFKSSQTVIIVFCIN